MGRHTYETTDVEPFGQPTLRLKPSSRLAPRAKAIFIRYVTDTAAGHFKRSDQGLLERLCEVQMLAEQAAEQLAAGAVVNGKISPWFWIHAGATKSMNNLALRLRLSPQSRSQRAVKT